jgi:protein ImuB
MLRRHPEWTAQPVAVVAEDKPQGLVLWSTKGRQLGVLPGRYAAALSLAGGLRAGEVAPKEIERAVDALTQRLIRFTPEVEPSAQDAGVFWLNGAGLKRLYASPRSWGYTICQEMEAQRFAVNLAVGFTRFGTYAVARVQKGITVFRDPAEEEQAARQVPLSRLDLDAGFRDALFKLGIKTVGGLLSLPPGGLRERFGAKAHRLYRMAAGDLWTPLDPCAPEEPVAQKYILDDPESDGTRLLFLIKQMLHPLLAVLATRAQALTALWLSFLIDRSGWLKEQIRPAVPTLDAAQILDLVRLRLESLKFSAGVESVARRPSAATAGCALARPDAISTPPTARWRRCAPNSARFTVYAKC